jgi:hypothetical protein
LRRGRFRRDESTWEVAAFREAISAGSVGDAATTIDDSGIGQLTGQGGARRRLLDDTGARTRPVAPSRPVDASVRYLLLADISGYAAFLAGVEETHGVDFSGGIPAGFSIIGALLDSVVDGVQPAFDVSKLEGDAVFATAPAADLDGRGVAVLERLRSVERAFREVQRRQALEASDHVCSACPRAASLSLKRFLHRGSAVTVERGGQLEVLGAAVNTVHRLLKNSVRTRIGPQPYILITDAAAKGLHVDEGIPHDENYDDIGVVSGRIIAVE